MPYPSTISRAQSLPRDRSRQSLTEALPVSPFPSSHEHDTTSAPDGALASARGIELARLVPLWPKDIADTSIEGRLQLVAKLERALRAERRRGIAGHWTYSLARHAQLLRAYREERAELARLTHCERKTGPSPGI